MPMHRSPYRRMSAFKIQRSRRMSLALPAPRSRIT
jgi:hypothetical protein